MTHPVTFCNQSMSLVERKKQQWAREREELARLGGQHREYSSFDRNYDRSRYGSKHSLTQKEQQQLPPITSGERRGSLPPLHQNQFNSNYRHDNKYDKGERGGETSGYGSDNYPTPDYKERNLPSTNNNGQWNGGNQQNQSGYESSSSYRDDRPKWGDKGVGINNFWQPKEESFDKEQTNEPPNWVKRGLEVDGAIVVANSSPSISPEQRYEENERPCTGSSSSQTKTYIRGQNIPIDSVELAERERKRQMAIAHQEAVRQQLQEKERQRQEEKARKLKEEHEEELRIAREQEFERQRKLEEERAFQEKMERERKRKEAIQEALEIAEREAKLEKMRLKMQKQCNNSTVEQNISENVVEKEKLSVSPTISHAVDQASPTPQDSEKMNNCKEAKPQAKNDNIKNEINNNLSQPNPKASPAKSTTSLPTSLISNQSHNSNNERSLTPIMQSPRNQNTTNNNFSPRNDQFTYFFQPTLESLQNIQYAVLIPTAQYPIAIPMNMPTAPERSNIESARTENRILTPTRYRNNVRKCDSSTQTDTNLISARSSSETTAEGTEKYICDKMSNVEVASQSRSRRSRSSSVVERPKWGANRPPTRYLKQSEKDPLYQRRKLRQKRDNSNKSYDEKISSDDSQAGTPVHYRKNILPENRRSRARWRTEERVFNGNLKMYQRELVPLESDKDQLYLKCCCSCRCKKHRCSENVTVDVLKIEEQNPRDDEQRYHLSSRIQKDISLPEFDVNRGQGVDLLGGLSTLHNGLLMEQEKWQDSPRSPGLSPRRA
ncbi:putative uncharacterized protein DDB_G0279653 [Anthonomus grandis grandis]|uniref:putative uncharacterized protein DDB_G0279653 n=1 Tax=Anthonomus grandis grandis TaxID=2921223 RepID=UPI0021651E29|nr:putative uncharacterized protein DDB_G0279653 [Anthonomus grandis grandis]XP_050301308.1 putative uncharacterized protein DDB_G0279653 [Anthonomus grandis grandis]